jgi:hypothetical protein
MSNVSTLSRVVPGISLTIIRSSRSKRLTSDDLPAFGRPTIAMPTSAFSGADAARGDAFTRSCSTIASSRSPVPSPCSADTSKTCSKPS